MRVALLSDIHGNMPALEAVLAEVDGAEIDTLVVPGDTVSGPFPAEVFDLLTERDALFVRGNADRLVVEGGEGAIGEWSADRLGDRLATVAAWPLTLEVEVAGLGRVLVCHATPDADDPIYTRITPEHEVARLFDGVCARVVACGHTHVQYDRTLAGGLRVVNPGSVGMPYEGQPGAFWAVLGPGVEMRRTEYDVAAAAAAIRETGAPDVVDQLVRHLLEPPDPDEVTRFFEGQRGS